MAKSSHIPISYNNDILLPEQTDRDDNGIEKVSGL